MMFTLHDRWLSRVCRWPARSRAALREHTADWRLRQGMRDPARKGGSWKSGRHSPFRQQVGRFVKREGCTRARVGRWRPWNVWELWKGST